MLLVSSGIWTRVAVSSSYDDNHYTTASLYSYKQFYFKQFDFAQVRS